MKNIYKIKLEKTFIFIFILYTSSASKVYAQFCGPNVPT